MQPLVFVLYDGINNSVFSGQVLQPLLKKRAHNAQQKIILITFEKTNITNQELKKYAPPESGIQVVVLKKIPFIGTISLYYAALQLKKTLASLPSYKLIARGPLAGWICARGIQKERCTSLTIQARGLLAEEYAYSNRNTKSFIARILHAWRMRQFWSIEKKVYSTYVQRSHTIKIEAVSPALKEYLIQTFGSPAQRITIATQDIPHAITQEEKKSWRTAARKNLAIPFDAHVYCYNGSAKPWQCPEEVIIFFKKQHKKDQRSFLLILTQDTQSFKQLLADQEINSDSYRVLTVDHADIYHYLCACDTGLLFRTPHIINWVSRPTKALEYQATHLTIIHNNTVGYLTN